MTSDEVLAAVRTHWDGDADDAEPVGDAARHWCVRVRGRPALFATLDATAAEAVHAAVATLAFRLDFVVAGLPTHDLAHAVPLAGGWLSCTPWVWGEQPLDTPETAAATATMLRRLHAVTPPSGLPRWEPPAGVDADGPWVVTHGHPRPHHQFLTPVRTLLTGWGSVLLAPAERDLWVLPPALRPDADPALIALFDAESAPDIG